jgi:hypothetical protein
MANKLAGQKAKFTKALADYNSTEDASRRLGAARQMAEVLLEAPTTGFSEVDVTGGKEFPGDVQQLVANGEVANRSAPPEDPDQLVQQLETKVDMSGSQEYGSGNETVYAYGYSCAPDRLKIGRCDGDVIGRIASQINTSTPDKPALFLVLKTHNCRGLEMAIHGILRLKRCKIVGGGDEWYMTTRNELLEIYKLITGD